MNLFICEKRGLNVILCYFKIMYMYYFLVVRIIFIF